MLQYQIGITLLPGIGDIIGKKLIAYCGGVEAVFKQKKSALEKVPNVGPKLVDSILSQNVLKRAEEEITFIEKHSILPLFYLDKKYPARLKNCADSPLMLYFLGNADLNVPKIVSIVGTRNATDYGKVMCDKIIEGLTPYDVLVVSGLAYGIDTNSHRAALENKLKTVAVLGHGLDKIYPYANKSLAQKMVDHGGLITDYLSKTNPDRENFPKRNRIIAGISDATIVIEAGKKGGALITAEIANSYNRDVFSVPGRIGDTFSEGCNFLIKTNKAALVQSADDVAYIMGWELPGVAKKSRQHELFVVLTEDEEKIVKVLRENDLPGIDKIIQQTGLTTSKVAAALLNLEFQGLLRALPGKVYKLDF
jgi:DNA processing protein